MSMYTARKIESDLCYTCATERRLFIVMQKNLLSKLLVMAVERHCGVDSRWASAVEDSSTGACPQGTA